MAPPRNGFWRALVAGTRLQWRVGAGGGGFAFSLVPPTMTEEALDRVRGALEKAGYTVLRTQVGGGGVRVRLMQ